MKSRVIALRDFHRPTKAREHGNVPQHSNWLTLMAKTCQRTRKFDPHRAHDMLSQLCGIGAEGSTLSLFVQLGASLRCFAKWFSQRHYGENALLLEINPNCRGGRTNSRDNSFKCQRLFWVSRFRKGHATVIGNTGVVHADKAHTVQSHVLKIC